MRLVVTVGTDTTTADNYQYYTVLISYCFCFSFVIFQYYNDWDIRIYSWHNFLRFPQGPRKENWCHWVRYRLLYSRYVTSHRYWRSSNAVIKRFFNFFYHFETALYWKCILNTKSQSFFISSQFPTVVFKVHT